eukprot:snap_masked-scaffold_15-processed-gene-7.10-mRNA-1 protein AED:1.00 eAED:1.00 QI:0/0/0/0/1/1/2/0/1248
MMSQKKGNRADNDQAAKALPPGLFRTKTHRKISFSKKPPANLSATNRSFASNTSKQSFKERAMAKGAKKLFNRRNRRSRNRLGTRKQGSSMAVMKPLMKPVMTAYKQLLSLEPKNFKASRKDGYSFKQGHRKRRNMRKRPRKLLYQAHRNSQRIQKAKTIMRKQFFEGPEKMTLEDFFLEKRFSITDLENDEPQLKMPDVGASAEADFQTTGKRPRTSSRISVGEFEIKVQDIPQGVDEDEFNAQTEEIIKAFLQDLLNFSDSASKRIFGFGKKTFSRTEEEKLEERQLLKRLEPIKKTLLSQQNNHVQGVSAAATNFITDLRRHLAVLQGALREKVAEFGRISRNFDANSFEHLIRDERDVDREGTGAGHAFLNLIGLGPAHKRSSVLSLKQMLSKNEINSPEHEKAMKEIRRLAELIEIVENEIYSVEIEQYFPRKMLWKIRLNAGDYCLGMRDLDLDSLKGNFSLKMGEENGVIFIDLKNIEAKFGISDLTISGSGFRTLLSRALIAPTYNRLDIGLTGDWTLCFKFQPAEEENNWHAAWVEDTERSSVQNLKLDREMTGWSALKLPTKALEYIATSVIPQALNSSIQNLFPPSLGSTLLDKTKNKVNMEGNIDIKQVVPSGVFKAPLIGSTPNAKKARDLLQLNDIEAIWLDLMLKGTLAEKAGYKAKRSASMYSLYKWRLEYAAHPLKRLKEMLMIIQKDATLFKYMQAARMKRLRNNISMQSMAEEAVSTATQDSPKVEVEGEYLTQTTIHRSMTAASSSQLPPQHLKNSQQPTRAQTNSMASGDLTSTPSTQNIFTAESEKEATDIPDDWLYEIIVAVEDLATKDVVCRLELTDIEVDLDLNNVVKFFSDTTLATLEGKTTKAVSKEAKKVALHRKVKAENQIKAASKYFSNRVLPFMSKTTDFCLDVYYIVLQGDVGLNFSDIRSGVVMQNFNIQKWMGWAPQRLKGYNLEVEGVQGGSSSNSSSYTVKLNHKWKQEKDNLFNRKEDEDDAWVKLKDIGINMFPKGESPGTISLTGESIQLWLGLTALEEFLAYWDSTPEREMVPSDSSSNLVSRQKASNSTSSDDSQDVRDNEVSLGADVRNSIDRVNRFRQELMKVQKEINIYASEELRADKEKKFKKVHHTLGRPPILYPDKNFKISSIKKDPLDPSYSNPYLPRLFLDPAFDLKLFWKNVAFKATKYDFEPEGVLGGNVNDSVRSEHRASSVCITIDRKNKYEQKPIGFFEMKWNLSEMFDDVKAD